MSIPILETERLTLRSHRAEDHAHVSALWAEPAVTRYTIGNPQSTEDAWHRLLRYAGHWSLLGFGYWVVEEKSTGAYLGEVGFADYKRLMDPPIGSIPEAGWIFAPSAHGKGYTIEAVQAIHDRGRKHFQAAQSACIIHPDNTPSLRLAAKMGYRETAHATYRNGPMILLHRDW